LEALALWSFHSAAPLRWVRLYQRINTSHNRFRSKICFLLNRARLLACRIFSIWMPGHCIQNRILCLAARVGGQERLIACSVLGKRNVAALPVKSTVFPLFTAARCPVIPLGCQSLLNQHANHALFLKFSQWSTIQPSLAKHAMAWHDNDRWRVDQSHPPKFECYSKPPNTRGWGLLMCWLWTTIINDRLFHISQVSQMSDRPHYLPVILGRFVCHSSRIPLGNDRYNITYEVTFPPWLHANLRSLFSRKLPSEQLFFLALRPRGTSRTLRHTHPAPIPEIIPHPYVTNPPSTSIDRKLIELHHERTSTGTIESHDGLKTWNIEAWKQMKAATKIWNISLPIFANLDHFVQR
jgi:hypothetical protein